MTQKTIHVITKEDAKQCFWCKYCDCPREGYGCYCTKGYNDDIDLNPEIPENCNEFKW